jgi:O-antigen/teichoic acid export membrane protein
MKIRLEEYDKNILKLFSGTAIAQAVSFILVPVIAKQYGPSEYGIYAAFVAAISVLSILSTGKYELAIMLPEKQSEVVSLMNLSYSINLLVSSIIAILMVFLPITTLNWMFGIEANNRIFFLIIPLATYLIGAFQTLNYWLVREKQFNVLSLNKILRSVLFGLFAIILGYIWPQALYLAISLTLSHLFSNIFLRIKLRGVNINARAMFSNQGFNDLKDVAVKYIKFPSYILPAEFMNVVCAQLPVFVFLWVFNPTESGYFSFILTVLNIPISLLAGAILDVFKERAAKDYRETGSCREAYNQTLKKMLLIAVVPFIILFFIGDELIVFFFGDKWAGAGKFLEIMLIMFFFKFISSPLSFIFYIVNKQKEDFLWHIYIFLSTSFVLYMGAIYFKDILLTLKLYSINFSIIYLIYLLRSYQLSKKEIAL